MGLIDNMQRLREDEYEEVFKSGGHSEADAVAQEQAPVDQAEVEYEPGKDDTYDPVRTYLAALGAVPLLKREQEVVLAKQIERGEKMVMTAISRSPICVEALLRTADEVRDGSRSIKNVVQVDSESPTAEKTELKRILKVTAEVSRLYTLALRRSRQPRATYSRRRTGGGSSRRQYVFVGDREHRRCFSGDPRKRCSGSRGQEQKKVGQGSHSRPIHGLDAHLRVA